MNKTMQDIARELGVSRTSVSLVLKGKGDRYRISKETQERILKKVEKENFKPNFFASNLTGSRTMTVGVVFPDLFEEFMARTLKGLGDVLDPLGYSLILMSSRFSRERERKNLDELVYRGCDGVIMMPVCDFKEKGPADFSHLYDLTAKEVPLILLDRTPRDWPLPAVLQDDKRGGEMAAAYLKEKGCRRFSLISLDLDISSLENRRNAFVEALPGAEEILLAHQREGTGDLEEALDKLARTIGDNPGRRGLFVTTAGLAVRVNNTLQQRGLTGGKDYHLVRFGTDPAGYVSTMAGIGQPHYEMGRRGGMLLMEQIGGKGSTGTIILPVIPES